MKLPRLVISATHRSSGKTTVTLGLSAALRARGLAVQPFKKGPDYIDPMWLTEAAGRSCRNLDAYLMGEENLGRVFAQAAQQADLSLVEGNTGLFDSVDVEGRGSTAALAKLLHAPVILVVDCHGLNRGVAPLLQGYRQFDPDLPLSGVILNRVSGSRHESKLRAAIERYCGIDVLGVLPTLPQLTIPERHLGLLPTKEDPACNAVIHAAGEAMGRHLDLDRLYTLAEQAPPLSFPPSHTATPHPPTVRIGIALDPAFTFYYPENLDALGAAGAELVPFSPMRDAHLPSVDGLYLGGGFPEVYMEALEANRALREEIRLAIEAGLPVYAECGGLMYLARRIAWKGEVREMVGALPCDVQMTTEPQGHGYVELEETGRGPWPSFGGSASGGGGGRLRGHEFHHSQVVNLNLGDVEFAYTVTRGRGIDGRHDGILYRHVVASYAHLHSTGTPQWAERFVEFVQRQKVLQGALNLAGPCS